MASSSEMRTDPICTGRACGGVAGVDGAGDGGCTIGAGGLCWLCGGLCWPGVAADEASRTETKSVPFLK
jgi:hypothetical protein